ncbi:MAG TPA: 16S rRNA (uracil(1498)-N(3))-methyltransferase [Desulfobacteraceae bacterium]|nr:16S rRNA (uracil(1498)-N(3))-methyltransferase [Desulfobacteraceae bacterium]
MRRFFTDALITENLNIIITGSEANHIKNVLRLRAGDKIILFNGSGHEYKAEIIAVSSNSVEAAVLQSIESWRESPADIIIAQAFLKEKKMDEMIRPLSELGISRWIPFIAERSVSRPDEKRLAARYERWKSIAKESLKQCRRIKMLEIAPVLSFEEILRIGQDCDLRLIFWEKAVEAIPTQGHKIIALLGPEGGFSESEVKMAQDAGFAAVTLGPRILRAETATIAASVMLQHCFGDMHL